MSNREEELYQEHVLDHYEDPYHRGPCERKTHEHEADNPLCGDVVHVELTIGQDGKIQDAWFQGEGCVISQASASMLMEKIEGMTTDQLKQYSAKDMLDLFGPKLTPNRQKCCLLPWRVAQAAVHAPVSGDDAEQDSGPRFAGPSLREES